MKLKFGLAVPPLRFDDLNDDDSRIAAIVLLPHTPSTLRFARVYPRWKSLIACVSVAPGLILQPSRLRCHAARLLFVAILIVYGTLKRPYNTPFVRRISYGRFISKLDTARA